MGFITPTSYPQFFSYLMSRMANFKNIASFIDNYCAVMASLYWLNNVELNGKFHRTPVILTLQKKSISWRKQIKLFYNCSQVNVSL